MASWHCALSACALLIGARVAPGAARQVGYDRPGGDYTSFVLRSGDPAQCARRCERDSRCRAWAFSYPATESAQRGLLAQVAGDCRALPTTCCVSGVRGAGVIEPRGGPIEFSIDRIGGDYRHFDLPPDPSGKSCQTPARPRRAAGPGPICAPATAGPPPPAISRITSPVRSAGPAAFPGWCGSGPEFSAVAISPSRRP